MAKKTVKQETQEIENGELKIENEGAVETNPKGDGDETGTGETNLDDSDTVDVDETNTGDGDETDPKGDDESGTGETIPDDSDKTDAVVVDVAVEDFDKKESAKLNADARRIMQGQNVKRVWRCPKTGYWFTKKDSADEQGKSQNVTMKLFEWED
jgi:hypothetical protein